MFGMHIRPPVHIPQAGNSLMILVFGGANLLFNIVANASFKVSAASLSWRSFLAWQIIGNVAGLITVITLTGLLRVAPLAAVFPITTGLAVVGVQVVAAHWLFHETISPVHWIGTLLIVAGIVLIGAR